MNDIATNKLKAVSELGNKSIYQITTVCVETIMLPYMQNQEGFKIYYDTLTHELLYIRYWYHHLASPEWYKETTLSPDEAKTVMEWRAKQ